MTTKPQTLDSAEYRLRVPAAMLIRDAISLMNEHSLAIASVIDPNGRIVGSLEQSRLIEALDRDSDELLKNTCQGFCGEQQMAQAA